MGAARSRQRAHPKRKRGTSTCFTVIIFYHQPRAQHFRTLTPGGEAKLGGRKGEKEEVALTFLCCFSQAGSRRRSRSQSSSCCMYSSSPSYCSILCLSVCWRCWTFLLRSPGEVMSHSGVSAPSTLRHAFNTVTVCMEEINGPPPASFFHVVTRSRSLSFSFPLSSSLSFSPQLSLSCFLLPGGNTHGDRQAVGRSSGGGNDRQTAQEEAEDEEGGKKLCSDKSNRSQMPQPDWMPPGPHDPPS